MKSQLHNQFQGFVEYVKAIYGDGVIPLHRPVFGSLEKQYLSECIDSNFVSSVSESVEEFEIEIQNYTGAEFAVSTMNGTAALHLALQLVGVDRNDEVITQALTFVATCNAISYLGATPVFVDVDNSTLGMSATALKDFLEANVIDKNGQAVNKTSGRRIRACVPMHTFGNPCAIEEIARICEDWGINMVEDSAESLGSKVGTTHTGLFGDCGILSFNGNKIITTGGGGMIITNSEEIAHSARRFSTTAKVPHPYRFSHDTIAYNYRMPGINAALGVAQMKRLSEFLEIKAQLNSNYAAYFDQSDFDFFSPAENTQSNNWLNTLIMSDFRERKEFLEYTNAEGIMTRPSWDLMTDLPMFSSCAHGDLSNTIELSQRIVNIPSSVPVERVN